MELGGGHIVWKWCHCAVHCQERDAGRGRPCCGAGVSAFPSLPETVHEQVGGWPPPSPLPKTVSEMGEACSAFQAQDPSCKIILVLKPKCYGVNVYAPPPSSYVEILTPPV